MINKVKITITVLAAIAIALPCAAFAEGEATALGQAVELTGGSLPSQLRDITGIGSGVSSWDYLSQKIAYGYFVEVYSNFDALAKSKVDRRNGIEDLVGSSYKTDSMANVAIADVKFNQDSNQRVMSTEFAQRSGRGTQIANTYMMNTYLPHSDGSVEYFKDGLLARVDNQRSVDEFGNVSLKNIYNFVYNDDRRLMLNHQYDRTDHLGNKTTGTFSCDYTGDSVFYGTDSTNANKHYLNYSVTETDHTGRVTATTWTAGTYDGKYLRDFTQKTVDAMPGKDTGTTTLHRFNIQYYAPGQISDYEEEGVANHIEGEAGSDVPFTYKLHRTNILYNGQGQVASYDETRREQNPDTSVWSADVNTWTKITSHVTLEYLDAPHAFGPDVDPDQYRIKKQTVSTKIENLDGSYRDETATTEYLYDTTGKLTGAIGTSAFTGLASDWISYTDADGHLLSRNEKLDSTGALVKDAQGNAVYEYSYVDSSTNTSIIVATASDENDAAFKALVTATSNDGNRYSGVSESTYEAFYGTPVIKSSHAKTQYFGADGVTLTTAVETSTSHTYGLVNNMVKLLSTVDTSISTLPALDAKGEYPTTRTITTDYQYNANGQLDTVMGTGTETGRDYSAEQGFINPYSAQITVTYDVKLDQPVEKNIQTTKVYDSTN